MCKTTSNVTPGEPSQRLKLLIMIHRVVAVHTLMQLRSNSASCFHACLFVLPVMRASFGVGIELNIFNNALASLYMNNLTLGTLDASFTNGVPPFFTIFSFFASFSLCFYSLPFIARLSCEPVLISECCCHQSLSFGTSNPRNRKGSAVL